MTDVTQHPDPVTRSDNFDQRLMDIGARSSLSQATASYQRNVRLLAVMVVLNILLSAVVAGMVVRVSQNAQSNAELEVEQKATCLAGNEGRATQIQLWDYLLSLPPTSPRTAAEEQQVVNLREYIHKQFAPRKCE